MKKQVLAITAMAGLVLGAAIAQGADSKGAGIVGSVHDLGGMSQTVGTIYGVSDPGKRICAFCHSPHHSTQDNNQDSAAVTYLDGTALGTTYKIYAPLWSRTDVGTITAPTPYQSQTFNPKAKNKAYDPLIGPSRLCLTCHDGTVALDAYYGNKATTSNTTGDAFNGPLGGGDQLSIGIGGGMMGLSNDHPIGMKYSDYQTDSANYELNADTVHFNTTDAKAGKTIAQVLYSDPLDANMTGFVTCASCHDVHNGTAVGNKAPQGGMRGFLLYGSQADSSFCLTCHAKNGTPGQASVPAGQ
jgi:cytochrome c553